jgi:hypothetical protein
MIGEIIRLGINIIDEVFMLYQSMNEFQKAHVNYISRVPNSA